MRTHRWITGEWVVDKTSAAQRRTVHYWLTIIWLTAGSVVWFLLRDILWFVGFMSLYAIWISHLAGWAAETPVEDEGESEGASGAEDDAQAGKREARPVVAASPSE